MSKAVLIGAIIVIVLFGTYFGLQYGQRLLQQFNTSSAPTTTTLLDQSVSLTREYFGGGYSWKMTLSSGEKLTVGVQSSDIVFLDLMEDRINSPLSLQCNSNPVYLLPQSLIRDTTGTTNEHWTVSVPEDCGYILSINPPASSPVASNYGQTISAHVIVKQIS